jgi:hypothetical protein
MPSTGITGRRRPSAKNRAPPAQQRVVDMVIPGITQTWPSRQGQSRLRPRWAEGGAVTANRPAAAQSASSHAGPWFTKVSRYSAKVRRIGARRGPSSDWTRESRRGAASAHRAWRRSRAHAHWPAAAAPSPTPPRRLRRAAGHRDPVTPRCCAAFGQMAASQNLDSRLQQRLPLRPPAARPVHAFAAGASCGPAGAAHRAACRQLQAAVRRGPAHAPPPDPVMAVQPGGCCQQFPLGDCEHNERLFGSPPAGPDRRQP